MKNEAKTQRTKNSFYRLFWFSYGVEVSAKKRFTSLGWGIVVGLFIGVLIGSPNQSLAYQIFTFLVAMLVMSIGWSYWFRFRYHARRLLPPLATVGEPLQYRIVIDNPTNKVQKGLKLWENFADPRPSFQEFLTLAEPGEEKRNKYDRNLGYYRWLWLIKKKQKATTKPIDLPPLAPRSSTEIIGEIMPYDRGLMQLKGLSITRVDPLGLYNAVKSIYAPEKMWILPKRYQLKEIKLPGARRYQTGGVAFASSVGESEEFMSLRDYRPGDPLRKIHWKSWAKSGKPIVKEEEDEFFVRHALILDTFTTESYSEPLEKAVSLAASFACEVQTQESLLDLMFVGTQAYCFTTGRGVGYVEQMLQILASVQACIDKPFDSLSAQVMERVSLLSGCICILLSWDESRRQLIEQLQILKIPFWLFVIVPNSQEQEILQQEISKKNLEHFQVLSVTHIQEELLN